MGPITGRGDAARTLSLLWESPTAGSDAGSGLTLDSIVAAATAIADERGDASVPLRAIGDRLGCTAMALYTYVGGKAELLDLMYDRAYAGFAATRPISVTEWAEHLLELYVEHPWMLDLAHARPVLGPHQQDAFESLLGTLLPIGLHHADVAAIASSAFSLAAAAARTVVDARRAPSVTGEGDEQWWADRMDALAAAAPDFADRYPLSSRLMGGDESAVPPPGDDAPIMERAARANLRRALELLLAGAAGSDRD
ncbi:MULTISPECIES: TetR/AcrR family transcriptional regulator [unclassified Rhodococcus (in: high G+C Gram-positive bacteria)]|uniref:TetR/AcrR family transcriptional regulator n=1 Tax=unclassified Rhodococcus (in: high G+C Gram-positive bacteria) TaxID=192944 RepID=UPI000E0C9185|nr:MULTISPECIES: TetR/AcrR family transcriptional regulator [unclassified Rhodococcus (in: high G+C Gram-positive bacteria)]QKT11380.1 TetR/AcrR family transcriptional regulator [Rhodococcus sp. W8901]RDI21775.1 TetR family transcriptional regulator [Rhodococcus sp. AG1013]